MMPHLLFRGVTVEQVKEMSAPLATKLAEVCRCEEDNFFFEVLTTTSIFGGQEIASYPFVEVAWFERGQQVRDSFAKAVTDFVLAAGHEEVEVAFRTYDANAYYANGTHFG